VPSSSALKVKRTDTAFRNGTPRTAAAVAKKHDEIRTKAVKRKLEDASCDEHVRPPRSDKEFLAPEIGPADPGALVGAVMDFGVVV
jgi:hypothetical protein